MWWETSSGAGLMALLRVQFGRVLAVANTCFRCLAPHGSPASLPKPRHQTETQALGRAPQRPPAVEPTQRRASSSVPGASAPRVVPPRVPAGNGNGDAQAVLKMLQGLGLSEDLLVQVATSLQPPPAKKVSSRERQMAHLKEQLHSLRGRISKQEEVIRKHTEQFLLDGGQVGRLEEGRI